MALKEALQRGSIQSSPYQKQGNVKNSDQLHMFSENQKAYFVVKRSLDIVLSFLLLAVPALSLSYVRWQLSWNPLALSFSVRNG
ncbi:MAG: hypothetical protein ACLT1K_00750 [[Clostridium] leptum]